MSMDQICIALRVSIICIVFACFVFLPLESRYKHNRVKTGLIVTGLALSTVIITMLFLTKGGIFSKYAMVGIVLWFIIAFFSFYSTIDATIPELAFVILVILNFYVNIITVAKVVCAVWLGNADAVQTQALVSILALIVYTPLMYIFFFKYYKQIVEFDIFLPFWRVIWTIPAMTYIIYYVKIVGDYWRGGVEITGNEIVFIIVWCLTTYLIFLVILAMLLQEYKGIMAVQRANLAESQLQMQEEQYERLVEHMENTSRLRHDWRHHLLIIKGFADNNEMDEINTYLEQLMPAYTKNETLELCENNVVNVVLKHYQMMAEEMGIKMKVQAEIPEELSITEPDVGIVFGNLLENAVQACKSQKTGEKRIEMKAIMQGSQLVVLMNNTYDNQVIQEGDNYISTKHEGKGRGIDSVRRVVEKYQGYLDIQRDDSFFTIFLIMNPREKGIKGKEL